MFRHSFHPVVLTILGLAVLGLGVSLFSDPAGFITSILVTIGVVTLLIILFRKFLMPKLMQRQAGFAGQQGMHARQRASAPKKPVSFSKKKKEKKRSVNRPLVKRQSDVKLTVIEGKKNKKKSRALF